MNAKEVDRVKRIQLKCSKNLRKEPKPSDRETMEVPEIETLVSEDGFGADNDSYGSGSAEAADPLVDETSTGSEAN